MTNEALNSLINYIVNDTFYKTKKTLNKPRGDLYDVFCLCVLFVCLEKWNTFLWRQRKKLFIIKRERLVEISIRKLKCKLIGKGKKWKWRKDLFFVEKGLTLWKKNVLSKKRRKMLFKTLKRGKANIDHVMSCQWTRSIVVLHGVF